MRTTTIDIPDSACSALRVSPDEFVHEMRTEAAAQWYAQGKISQAKAAEIAGISRAKFIDELARRQIAVDQVNEDELIAEIADA